MQVAGVEIGVYALVGKGYEWLLFGAIQILGDKRVGVNDQRICRARRFRIRHVRWRGAGVFDLVDFGDIGKAYEPEDVFHALEDLVVACEANWGADGAGAAVGGVGAGGCCASSGRKKLSERRRSRGLFMMPRTQS